MGNELDSNTQPTQTNDDNQTEKAHPNDIELAKMCQDLIKMGFDENLAFEVAQIYPNNLNDALDLISNKEAIDKAVNEESDENNDSKSDDQDKDGYDAENEEDENDTNHIISDELHCNDDGDDKYHKKHSVHNEQSSSEFSNNNNENKVISETLETADIVIKGEYDPDASAESMLIITDLIQNAMSNNTVSTDEMMISFNKWSAEVTEIKLNSFYYEDVCKCLLMDHKRVKNLYAFDKINEMFKNVETIEAYHTGWISLFYLEALLQILDNIHYLEHSKLHKIYLHDINNMGSISSTDFEQYQTLFRQKQWQIDKDVSAFIVSRYY